MNVARFFWSVAPKGADARLNTTIEGERPRPLISRLRPAKPLHCLFSLHPHIRGRAAVSIRTGTTTKLMCQQCADRFLAYEPEGRWSAIGPCPICGTKTYISRSIELNDRKHNPVMCTSACNRRHHLNLALEKRHAARQPRKCAAKNCEKTFLPVRSDQNACSNKCRQKLHRERHRRAVA
jgi:hypothetical protein